MRLSFAKIFGAIAALLILLLALGFLLPSTWSAEFSLEVQTEAEVIFPYLHDLEKWDEWTVWKDVDSDITEPSYGNGARRYWDDEDFGSGQILIVQSDPPQMVQYMVTLDSGAQVSGTFLLTKLQESTLITWIEKGDLGANPLMGYLARGIGKSQTAQMKLGLERLKTKFFD